MPRWNPNHSLTFYLPTPPELVTATDLPRGQLHAADDELGDSRGLTRGQSDEVHADILNVGSEVTRRSLSLSGVGGLRVSNARTPVIVLPAVKNGSLDMLHMMMLG